MNKETVKKVYRKTIASGLGLVTGLSISLHNPEKSKAQNSSIEMTPITMAEDRYNAAHWNQNVISQYHNILKPQDNNKYEYIGMPAKTGFNYNDDGSKVENDVRFKTFYGTKTIPRFAINGKLETQNILDNWNSFIGLQIIKEGIETKKQYADFTLQPNEKGFYTLKVTGINDQLNDNKNLNLNAIVLKREVNCKDNNDSSNTTILKQIAYKYPMGALGESFQIKNKQVAEKQLDLGIKDSEKAMCGLVAFLQNMKTKEIIAASYTDLTPETPALFNIDHLPDCTVDNVEQVKNFTSFKEIRTQTTNQKEYQEQIGLRQKIISVTNAKNLRHLSLELDYTEHEAQVYDVLGAALSEEFQAKAKLEYDPKEHRVTVKFNEPLNGDHDIFNFFIKIHTNTKKGINHRTEKDLLAYATNFKFKNFSAEDSEFNSVKYELNQQQTYHPVRMVTTDNPLDFNSDTNIDEKDIQEFLPAFGVTDKDSNYINKYDIYPQNIKEGTQGDGIINVLDLYHLVKAVSEQEKLAKMIQEVNPDFVYPAIDQSIKTKVLTQLCDIIPPLGLGLDQNQELTFEAIANQIEDIYKIHGKTITKKEESKSLYQRIQEFFNTPTPHAISKKREKEIQG